jgi:hypothetical protein
MRSLAGTFSLPAVYETMQMKRSRLLRSLGLVLMLSAGVSLVRAETNETPVIKDAYGEAVAAYVDAAKKETATYRDEIALQEKAGKKENYAAAKVALRQCEELAARLGEVGHNQFDPLKARYEKARADLRQKLADARAR